MSHQLSGRKCPSRSNFDAKLEGLSLDDVGVATRIVSSYRAFPGTPSKPLVPPIVHSSTFELEEPEDLIKCVEDGGATYSRLGNPTTEELEATINAIERGAGSLTFSSGMSAITSVLNGFLEKGDHVVLQIPCYPGTLTWLEHMVQHFGVEWTKVSFDSYDDVASAIRPNTKMIWIETPCNPNILVIDIERIVSLCRPKNILVGVDGTFASPHLQKAIELGADFSAHSCTKYMGGHSDLLAGCVTTRTIEQWRRLKLMQTRLGNMLSPHDASLLHRSLKTLPLRMERTSDTALKVASFLEKHPKVQLVHYPGLTSHPQHEIAAKQMKSYSGMIMFDMRGGGPAGKVVAQSIKVIKMAVSLGGVESIMEHPYSMTHGPSLLGGDDRDESGITPGMIRLSIGLEDPEDLIRDLQQAFDKVEVET